VLSDLIYVEQGGSEAVVYRIGDGAVRDGVSSGDAFFPGYPLPGGADGERFALFAVPYDLADPSRVLLEVEDALGNRASTRFLDRFKERKPRVSSVQLSDSFLDKVVPEIVARSPEIAERDSQLESYLAVNGELREINARQLRELAVESVPQFLWRRPFLQQPNTQVTDSFAAHRTYYYQDREVDQQDHLGYDLASVKRAPIEAANSGRVVLARYFGIYGNTVVLDHGYGLMTLYAHLSSIEVEPGQEVERGQVLGRSGETGLAGGDHLHFTVLLQGEPVDPVEWFDAKWIRDRLVRKLGSAFDFAS
jgi:murein DD-endopeptidase MepM/ murein hydrolase activator NlpD